MTSIGTWSSTFSIDDVLSASVSISSVVADSGSLYWLESLPMQDGRTTIKRMMSGEVVELTPDFDVRSRLYSYGGGAYDVDAGRVVFVSDETLWLLDGDELTKLTDQPIKLGGVKIFMDCVYAVQEDEDENSSIVEINLKTKRLKQIVCDADFYANPVPGPDRLLAWTQWQQPAMPWDSSCLFFSKLRETGRLPKLVAGKPGSDLDGVSVQHPRWQSDGSLVYVSDESGYYNLHRMDDGGRVEALHNEPYDFDIPQWIATNAAHAPLGDGQLVSLRVEGKAWLGLLKNGQTTKLLQVSEVDSIDSDGDFGYAIVHRSDLGPAIIKVSASGKTEIIYEIKISHSSDEISVAKSLIFEGPRGRAQAWFYAPQNPKHTADQLPPVLVLAHSGPTLFRTDQYDPQVQFWTSRGFAVLDVNYSGSAGFGREFRNRLRESWTIADRDDVIAGLEMAVNKGLVNGKKAIISGSSAGGLTVFSALAHSDAFAGGISRYGVADLSAMVGGPKFEARYLDSLVGQWPEEKQRYEQRSPINSVSRISCPMLILQGSEDPIVPLKQSEGMTEALRDAGVEVELIVFENESHGFRGSQARKDSLEAQYRFAVRVLKLD